MATMLVAAGGTGGHVFPALAVARVLRSRGHNVEFCGGTRFEATAVPEAGFALHHLPVRTFPLRPSPAMVAGLAANGRAFFSARRLLRRIRAEAVVALGGYPAVAPVLAAVSRRIPVVQHEQNAELLVSQRATLRWARKLALSLPIESDHQGVITGNPVRPEVTALADPSAFERARRAGLERFGLDPSLPVVLVTGGSQGASALNDAVIAAAQSWPAQILHVAGRDHAEAVRRAYRPDVRAVVVGFVEAMHEAYAASDVVVQRGGATTVAEVAIAGLASVIVPPPWGSGWSTAQQANARAVEAAGAGIVVEQARDDFREALGAAVRSLLADSTRRQHIRAAARTLAHPDAGDRLADLVESVLR